MRSIILSSMFLLLLCAMPLAALDMSGVTVGPVPFRPAVDGSLKIYSLPGDSTTISIYDVNGDACYTATHSVATAYWSGYNNRGNAVSPGLYILKIISKKSDGSDMGVKTFRILVVR